jgi:hypothetical protein
MRKMSLDILENAVNQAISLQENSMLSEEDRRNALATLLPAFERLKAAIKKLESKGGSHARQDG